MKMFIVVLFKIAQTAGHPASIIREHKNRLWDKYNEKLHSMAVRKRTNC
jgi:hypothetical protein